MEQETPKNTLTFTSLYEYNIEECNELKLILFEKYMTLLQLNKPHLAVSLNQMIKTVEDRANSLIELKNKEERDGVKKAPSVKQNDKTSKSKWTRNI